MYLIVRKNVIQDIEIIKECKNRMEVIRFHEDKTKEKLPYMVIKAETLKDFVKKST